MQRTDTVSLPAVTYNVQENDILCSNTACYLIQDFIGQGGFGKVARCLNLITSQKVALKILKADDSAASEKEIEMLKAVSVLDSNKTNVARFLETFEYRGQTCLAFKMLDRNLLQLHQERHGQPLSLSEIRPIAKQLLTAFDALKGIGVVHSDLKANNIMLVNHPGEPFRVKLIDFGLAFTTSENLRGAPEVTLGLPISEAIDTWGLCEYQTMRGTVEIVDQPPDHLLSAGDYTHMCFKVNQHCDNPKWSLKTPTGYLLSRGIRPKTWKSSFKSLDNLITLNTEMQVSKELEDKREFVSLLKALLDTDTEKRITPKKALQHPFITMAHLKDETGTSLYVEDAFDKMLVCPVDDSEEELPPAISQLAASSADETPASDGSPDEGLAPVKTRKSRLKRIRKFFGRVMRTLFGKKKC